jgi:hypothetical protein
MESGIKLFPRCLTLKGFMEIALSESSQITRNMRLPAQSTVMNSPDEMGLARHIEKAAFPKSLLPHSPDSATSRKDRLLRKNSLAINRSQAI